MKQEWPRCRLVRRGPCPFPGRPVLSCRGSGLQRSASRRRSFFSERDRPEAALPGPGVRCPPSARKGKRGGRDAEMCISAQEPSPSCLSFSKQPLPHRLSTAVSGREGRGVSLHLRSIAQLSPFPGVTSLISFFLDHLFFALVRLGKSIISRFPLPWSLSRGLEGLISQLDFNYPFEDDDAEPRAAAWAAGLSPPVSRPAVPPRRTQHLPKTD